MEASFLPYIGAFIWLAILLTAGTFLRAKVKFFQSTLIPASLIGGGLGFICAQFGIIGLPTPTGWVEIPTSVYSVITFHLFAFGFVGVGLMRSKEGTTSKTLMQGGLWMSFMFGLIFVIQALIGFAVFSLWKEFTGSDLNPIQGFLLGVGFTQGPGQAHAYGSIWEATYLVANSISVGLAAAAFGFLAAVVVGVPLATLGIKRGWVANEYKDKLPDFFLRGIMDKDGQQCCAVYTTHPANIDSLGFHFSVMTVIYGLAYCFALLWYIYLPTDIRTLGFGILFTWGMCIGMLVRISLAKIGAAHIIDSETVKRITNTSVDYMICAVFLAISVSELKNVIIPLIISVILISFVTLVVVIWFAKRAPGFCFERALAVFGCYTGTAASGLLLLRIVDPNLDSPAAVELGIMNVLIMLICQPLFLVFPFIPKDGFPILWILLAYLILTPVAMYFTGLLKRKSTW